MIKILHKLIKITPIKLNKANKKFLRENDDKKKEKLAILSVNNNAAIVHLDQRRNSFKKAGKRIVSRVVYLSNNTYVNQV